MKSSPCLRVFVSGVGLVSKKSGKRVVDLGIRLHGAREVGGILCVGDGSPHGGMGREDTGGRGDSAVRFFDAALMCSK